MRRFFQFVTRAKPALPSSHLQVSDFFGAQLAISSSGQHSEPDCFCLRVSSTRTVFALLEAGGRGEQKRDLITSGDAAIRQSAPDLLSAEDANEADAMVEVCSRLNMALLQTSKRIVSCTAFCGCYNERLGTVCYFNAGHIPAMLSHDAIITELPATGLPLGLFSHSTPDAPTVALPPGAALLVTSRRFIHARSGGAQFGFGRLKERLQNESAAGAGDLCGKLFTDLQVFMGKHRLHDASILALSRAAGAVAAAG